MKSTFVRSAFYALALLTPFAAQASLPEHEARHINHVERHHQEDRYLSQSGYVSPPKTLPTASVPEPGSLALVGAGIIGLVIARRKST